MVWKCFPLNLHNWSNSWKWKEEMNANELADWLETGEVEEYDINEAAVMLRKQQERLQHLEKMIVWYQDITMTGGWKTEDYENGFWDAVDFVKRKQVND